MFPGQLTWGISSVLAVLTGPMSSLSPLYAILLNLNIKITVYGVTESWAEYSNCRWNKKKTDLLGIRFKKKRHLTISPGLIIIFLTKCAGQFIVGFVQMCHTDTAVSSASLITNAAESACSMWLTHRIPFLLHRLDLVHSQILCIYFHVRAGFYCCRHSSCSWPEGNPGVIQKQEMTLQGELKDRTGQLSPLSLGFLQPRAHSSSMLSLWRFCFLLRHTLDGCVLLQASCLHLPLFSVSLQRLLLMTDIPALSPGSGIPNKTKKLKLYECLWDLSVWRAGTE